MPTGSPPASTIGRWWMCRPTISQQHLEGEGVDRAGDRVGGHHRGDRDARVDARGEHPGAQVAVGDDAGEPLGVHDEQRRHPVLGHHPGRVAHGGRGVDGHRLAADEVAHPGLEDGAAGRRQLQRRDRAAHPAGALGVEEGVDLGVVGAQPVEVVGGQQQGQRVLDGGHVEGRRVALGQADRAEARPLAAPVDQAPLGVVHLGRPRAQHVEVVVVAPALDQPAAPAEVLDAHPRREGVEHGVRQHVEGLVVREEVARLGQLDVEGHAPHRGSAGDAGAVAPGWWRARRAASLDERASAPAANPRAGCAAAGMRLRAAAGGAREEGGEP